ncbi:MAG: type II toxin-antitoxin system RelE/ParE family toxin [Hungatella hathewayi]|nr:type II toxin-antitoxin system RelE/ParE family toxin [Hungatella hathewayi]
MTKTFIQTIEFSKNWDKLGFDDDDLRRLELEIASNPQSGSVVQGTGKLRKMRFAYLNEGKRGSTRVCYVHFAIRNIIYLITIYPKNVKDNLSKAERNAIKIMIDKLEENL